MLKLNDQNTSSLIKLGLSPNQAKVYLALVILGSASAKSIWTLSEINREEVYRKINELVELGFVERIFTKPYTFRAAPLESTTSTLLKRKAENLSQLKIETDELIQTLAKQKKINEELNTQPSIILVPEHKPLYDRARNELETVKQSLDTICPWKKGLTWLQKHYEYFLNALNREVKIRFILEKNSTTNLPIILKKILDHSNFQIKFVKILPPTCMGLYDQKQLLIDTSARSLFVETPCLWSNNPSIVGMGQIYFETIWNKTKQKPP